MLLLFYDMVIILFKLQLTNIDDFLTQFVNYPSLNNHQLGKKTVHFVINFFLLYCKNSSPFQDLAEGEKEEIIN